MAMSEEAKEAQRQYMKEYRKKNRERIRKKQADWARKNPDKVRAMNKRYWEKKAKEMQS